MIDVFKRKEKKVFGDLEDMNLFKQKFQILHHIVEDVARYGDISRVDAPAFKCFNIIVNTYVRMTSFHKRRKFEKTVRIINFCY